MMKKRDSIYNLNEVSREIRDEMCQDRIMIELRRRLRMIASEIRELYENIDELSAKKINRESFIFREIMDTKSNAMFVSHGFDVIADIEE